MFSLFEIFFERVQKNYLCGGMFGILLLSCFDKPCLKGQLTQKMEGPL